MTTTTEHTKVRPLPANTIMMVTGVSFRQEAVRQVVEYDEVRIRHDRTNPYDEHACQVLTLAGTQLGFVPRDLAQRLARQHPGGTWRGRIEDVLRNDTWGLRVRLGPLLDVSGSDVGKAATGLRHRGDGVITAPNGSVALQHGLDNPDEPAPDPAQAQQVYAKSGRLLGDLVEVDGTVVHVHTIAGRRARYPHTVVNIRPAG